jgi:hypothetical protein
VQILPVLLSGPLGLAGIGIEGFIARPVHCAKHIKLAVRLR